MSDDRRGLTRGHVIAATLACAALAATIIGRLTACPGCEYQILGVPLFAAGAAFYLLLGVLALVGTSLKLIGWLTLPGIVIQAGLARFLFMLGAPCLTCLAAAGALFALGLVCLWPGKYSRGAPIFAAVAGFALLPTWSSMLVETERLSGLPEFARMADLRDPPGTGTLLVVYVRPKCSFCKTFETDYEPRLAAEFGSNVTIRKVDATDRRGLGRVPTFLFRSPDGSLVVMRGLSQYDHLVARLREAK